MSATEELLTELLDERERIIDKKESELAAQSARIEKLEAALQAAHIAMQKARDDIPEQAYMAFVTVVPEWLSAWDKIKVALKGGS